MKTGVLQAKYQSVLSPGNSDDVGCGELARIFGVTEQRISQLVKEGMPRKARGTYSLKACSAFYIFRLKTQIEESASETIIVEKIRLTRAKARKAELEAEKLSGGAIDQEQARYEIMHLATTIKEAFLSLPGSLAPAILGLDAGQIKAKIETAVTEILNQVAEKIENYESTIINGSNDS